MFIVWSFVGLGATIRSILTVLRNVTFGCKRAAAPNVQFSIVTRLAAELFQASVRSAASPVATKE